METVSSTTLARSRLEWRPEFFGYHSHRFGGDSGDGICHPEAPSRSPGSVGNLVAGRRVPIAGTRRTGF